MTEPALTIDERAAINGGRWFASLSPTLRHDILRRATVQRFHDGDVLAARGEEAQAWIACAKGAVRVSSISLTGKQTTLDYVEPGIWFGDVSMFDGGRRTHDACAHGETTIVTVAKADFFAILGEHVELYEALLRLQARRIRLLFGLVEDLNSLPLRARLAKQLLHLGRAYGECGSEAGERRAGGIEPHEVRITLQLAQEELAHLLGASRQRVNQELKTMEREGLLRVDPAGMVLRDRAALGRIADDQHPAGTSR